MLLKYCGFLITVTSVGTNVNVSHVEDVGKELDSDKYPVMSRLFESGVSDLLEYAKELGYTPEPDGYHSKCELCFSIRKYLITRDRQSYPELTPESLYRQNF